MSVPRVSPPPDNLSARQRSVQLRASRLPLILLALGGLLLIVALAMDPPMVLMAIGVVYVVSGLVVTLSGRRQWRKRRSKRSKGDD